MNEKDKNLEDFEDVICEMSARIRPGDTKCLSFFRSLTNISCRNCNLAELIDKLVNPVMREKASEIFKSSYNKRNKSEDEPSIEEVETEVRIPIEVDNPLVVKIDFSQSEEDIKLYNLLKSQGTDMREDILALLQYANRKAL
jgi:hypothetical protein